MQRSMQGVKLSLGAAAEGLFSAPACKWRTCFSQRGLGLPVRAQGNEGQPSAVWGASRGGTRPST